MKNPRNKGTPPPVRKVRAESKDFKKQVEQATATAASQAGSTAGENLAPQTPPPSTKKLGNNNNPSTGPSMKTVPLTKPSHLAHGDDSASSATTPPSDYSVRLTSNNRNNRANNVDQNCQCLIL